MEDSLKDFMESYRPARIKALEKWCDSPESNPCVPAYNITGIQFTDIGADYIEFTEIINPSHKNENN